MFGFPDIAAALQAGATNPWLLLPVAVLLGALHALEPGHSKALMAGFIVAIRGTPSQAVLLGVSAAIGHTLVVWVLALIGLWIGDKLIAAKAEPWLMLASGLLIVAMAVRLLRSTRGEHGHDHAQPALAAQGHDHDHHHVHDNGHSHDHHAHGPGCGHDHASPEELAKTYRGRTVTPGEIAWFGFTGGLMPCPAAIAVLLVCIQLKKLAIGIAMVAAFSLGLAVTLVTVGVAAAWGTRRAAASWSGFDARAPRLPVISGTLVLAVGLAFAIRGLTLLGQA